ncbi:MAG TPA: M1 family metallopeptidase [Gemmatimonadaceae bacterium]|nr:M1 family metallopeptidase [Gemmatimonadaceae bacterium]
MLKALFASSKPISVKSWSFPLLGITLLAAPVLSPLYMPRNVKAAVAKGTRTLDGRPGAKYWQNHARYTITVTALPPDRTIRGAEQIVYVNDSPDTLRRVGLKLFMNIHKPGAPRVGGVPPDYLTDGVHVDALTVDGQSQKFNDSQFFTVAPVRLPAPLVPHDSVRLSFDWHYELAKLAGREGMIDSTTFYIAYFYPRVAVYDDYNGWDTMNFTDAQEFYSDFNDYDVTVRAPANFIVWGTGTLRNAAEVLQSEYVRRFESSLTSDQTVHIATKQELASHAVTAQVTQLAWHFTSTSVPDVAFGLSDHYDWDGGSVIVDSAAHRRASVQAAYNDTASDFHYMVQMAAHSLAWLSSQWPGVPYPYEKTTVFEGGAGMEYPMMVNDESYKDTTFADFVAAHEIAHTYMPFYMGINETRYGFMDEGWATTFEYLINQSNMGPTAAAKFYEQFRVNGWAHDPSPVQDLPIITPGDVLSGSGLGSNEYGKASIGYLAMKDLLGDAMFKKCLQAYVARWHGKHPTPWDFFYTFDNVSGQDLNWFWTNWYFGNNYVDVAVKSVAKAPGGYRVTIDNVGGMAAPVDLGLTFADGSTQTVHETPAIWRANQKTAVVTVAARKALSSLLLDGGIWVDADTTNNRWTAGHATAR